MVFSYVFVHPLLFLVLSPEAVAKRSSPKKHSEKFLKMFRKKLMLESLSSLFKAAGCIPAILLERNSGVGVFL